jgi:hypothetical protein
MTGTDAPRERDRILATALRAAQWLLDDVAHAVARGRVTQEQWVELDATLVQLSQLVHRQATIPHEDDSVDAPGEPLAIRSAANPSAASSN